MPDETISETQGDTTQADTTQAEAAKQPEPTVAEARAALWAWRDHYCRDSAIARDTHHLNQITAAVTSIDAALNAVKE